MPQAVGGLILIGIAETPLIGFLGFGAATAISSAVGTVAVSVALSVGTSYLTQSMSKGGGGALNAPAPRPEDVQQSTRQATAPRIRHYGRVKASGIWVFAASYQGSFHKVLAYSHGQCDAIESYWVDEQMVTLNGDGLVTLPSILADHCRIQSRLGTPTETPHSTLTALFPEWTSNHRGDGVGSLFCSQFAVADTDYLATFPNGINTNYRVVVRGAQVRNMLTGNVEWSDNAADVIHDYMSHADGMRLPSSIFTTPQASAAWQKAHLRATENVALAAGGSEDRYRLWGSYRLDERPAEVLGRMLACCDGRLFPTSDGGLALDIGTWQEPSVVIDESVIVGFSDLSRGRDILSTANTIRATYTEPSQDYQTADADPWVDEEDVSERGEIGLDVPFMMSPSHSQTRRLMKIAAYRANPDWIGQFQCNLKALAAINQRFVRIRYAAFGIDAVCEVQDFRLEIGQENIVQGVTLQVQAMPQAAYQWNAATEQGTAPVSEVLDVTSVIPLPEGFDVEVNEREVGSPTLYARLSFSAPPSLALKTQARGRLTTAADWIPINVADGATGADSFDLIEGEDYEFQVRHVSTGSVGDWTASIIVIAEV